MYLFHKYKNYLCCIIPVSFITLPTPYFLSWKWWWCCLWWWWLQWFWWGWHLHTLRCTKLNVQFWKMDAPIKNTSLSYFYLSRNFPSFPVNLAVRSMFQFRLLLSILVFHINGISIYSFVYSFFYNIFFCGSHLCDVCVSSSCYCQVVFHFINTQNCYLFFPLLVPILVVSSFELCVEQLWTFLSKSLYKYMFLFLLDRFLKIKLLGQKVGIYIMNMPNLSLKLLCHFIF